MYNNNLNNKTKKVNNYTKERILQQQMTTTIVKVI